jgi:hypothetical protein
VERKTYGKETSKETSENLKKENFKNTKKKGNFKIKISDFIVRFFSYLNDVASHA